MISVIVATHNRRRLLEETLHALVRQDWPKSDLEIVVVDNASTDDTPGWLAARGAQSTWPRIVALHESQPGKSHAVNRGVARAAGRLLLFTDDDVLPDVGWVRAMVGAMDETGADFGVGRIRPKWETNPPTWLSPALHGVLAIPDNGSVRLLIGAGRNEHVMPIGANMALKPSVVERIGGWRSELGKLGNTLRSGEDHEFYLRMLQSGLEGVYQPTASVQHLVPASRLRRPYFRHWMRDNGRVVAAVERWHPPAVRRLIGVPRYLWGDALRDARALLSPSVALDPARRFAASTRLWWFTGYLQGAWFAEKPLRDHVLAPSVTRQDAARAYQER